MQHRLYINSISKRPKGEGLRTILEHDDTLPFGFEYSTQKTNEGMGLSPSLNSSNSSMDLRVFHERPLAPSLNIRAVITQFVASIRSHSHKCDFSRSIEE